MLEFLDGGMIYELNKIHQDLGQTALLQEPHTILKIYQSYLDSGANYLTTCNYGFKSLKLPNWKMLVRKSVDLLYEFKSQKSNLNSSQSNLNSDSKNLTQSSNTPFKILGSLPPYFESYYDGVIDKDFISFYETLVEIMLGKVDYFLLETQVSILHIRKILEIIHNHSLRNRRQIPKVMVSIYPQGNISGREIKQLVIDYSFMLDAILVNCGSLPKIRDYFTREIEAIDLAKLKIKFGFYCNKIDEQGYKNYEGDKKNKVKITDFYEDSPLPCREIDLFRNYLDLKGYDVIIGGCCGYGMKEMEELINQVKYLLVRGTARL